MPTLPTLHTTVDTPIGALLLTADDTGLTRVLFPHTRGRPACVEPGWLVDDGTHGHASMVLDETRQQLADYFAGRRRAFALPLAPHGTAFQRRVWEALARLGWGETVSYAELARRAGVPRSARAVGAANGRNPLPIVVPCHRVIGADGTLTGFGGGVETKAWLLAHEGAWPAAAARTAAARTAAVPSLWDAG
jgi:methylated-DNA-[protein]-cysteine S-methyltransferase